MDEHTIEKDACVCHGADRPHPPHLPCNKGCQPDWHRDDCAVYTRVTPSGVRPRGAHERQER